MFGLKINSESNTSVIDSDAFVYGFIGQCEYMGRTLIGNQSGGVRTALYRVHYPYPYAPLIFTDLDIGDTSAIFALSYDGSAYWSFRAYGSIQDTPSKHLAFAKLPSPLVGGYGLRGYSPSGDVVFDSTVRPLWVTDYFAYPNITLTAPSYNQISGVFRPDLSNPIFLTSSPVFEYTPPTKSFKCAGIKRTGTNSFASCNTKATTDIFTVTRSYSMMVADFPL